MSSRTSRCTIRSTIRPMSPISMRGATCRTPARAPIRTTSRRSPGRRGSSAACPISRARRARPGCAPRLAARVGRADYRSRDPEDYAAHFALSAQSWAVSQRAQPVRDLRQPRPPAHALRPAVRVSARRRCGRSLISSTATATKARMSSRGSTDEAIRSRCRRDRSPAASRRERSRESSAATARSSTRRT